MPQNGTVPNRFPPSDNNDDVLHLGHVPGARQFVQHLVSHFVEARTLWTGMHVVNANVCEREGEYERLIAVAARRQYWQMEGLICPPASSR